MLSRPAYSSQHVRSTVRQFEYIDDFATLRCHMCTWLSILVIDTPVFWQEDDFELILITVILLESMSGMSCGPCHMIAPVFRKISKDFAGKAYFRKATRWTSDNLFVRCMVAIQMSAFTVAAGTLMYIDRWNQIFGIRESCQPAITLWP